MGSYYIDEIMAVERLLRLYFVQGILNLSLVLRAFKSGSRAHDLPNGQGIYFGTL